MFVRDVVNINAHRILPTATVRQAAEQLSTSHCSDLMVVDAENSFQGVLSEGDLIRNILPNLEDLAQGGGMAGGNDLMVSNSATLASSSIDSLIIRDAITLALDDKLIRAAGLMISKQIRCLPVVSDGKLVGSVTRADVCAALLKK